MCAEVILVNKIVTGCISFKVKEDKSEQSLKEECAVLTNGSLENAEIHKPRRGQHFSLPKMSLLFQTHQ